MGAVLLDITRSLSRFDGKHPTGIDRVERAYIDFFGAVDPGFRAVGRYSGRWFLFDRAGLSQVLVQVARANAFDQSTRSSPGALGRWSSVRLNSSGAGRTTQGSAWHRVPLNRLRQRIFLQRTCLAHSCATGLAAMIDGAVPPGVPYVNVSHIAPDQTQISGLARQRASVFLLHDMIPLDHPEFQTQSSRMRFERFLNTVSAQADLVICNSRHTRERAVHWTKRFGRVPPLLAAPLGVERRPPVSASPEPHPYFVQLGTIEPRKNHDLTLKVWAQFWQNQGSDAPHLHIVGRRGWQNETVFATLDNAPFMGKVVFEHGTMSDQETASLLSGASGLLFPSHAEGFGFPVFEARQLGVPALVRDLSVYREFDHPLTLYMPDCEIKTWAEAVTELVYRKETECSHASVKDQTNVPNWGNHFECVVKSLEKHRLDFTRERAGHGSIKILSAS